MRCRENTIEIRELEAGPRGLRPEDIRFVRKEITETRKFDNFINKEEKITIYPNIGIRSFGYKRLMNENN